jgi:organic radical activating enzyme
MPIGHQADVDVLHALLARGVHQPDVHISLQPLSLSRKATALCADMAMQFGWRVSVQTHALVSWR